jgi:hypothetical protein
MACLFDGRIPMGYQNDTIYPPSIFAQCARETAVMWSTILQCYHDRTTLVPQLQYEAYMATWTTNLTYVPWVTLNGQHVHHDDDDNTDTTTNHLLDDICRMYYNDSSSTTATTTDHPNHMLQLHRHPACSSTNVVPR